MLFLSTLTFSISWFSDKEYKEVSISGLKGVPGEEDREKVSGIRYPGTQKPDASENHEENEVEERVGGLVL